MRVSARLVLSVTTGVLLVDDFSDVHGLLDVVAGRAWFTHELPDAADQVGIEWVALFPELQAVTVPEWQSDDLAGRKAEIDAWLESLYAAGFPREFDVPVASDPKGCRGCGVGGDDECLDDCDASALLRAGWSLDEIDRLLDGPDAAPLGSGGEGAGLTDEEHELMDVLSDVSARFRRLIRPDRSRTAAADWAEVASRVHDLQARVLATGSARRYPGRYRSLVGER